MSKELKGRGRGTYNGVEQHTFLTPDAKDALLAYKEWREENGETITKNSPLFTILYGQRGPKRLPAGHIRKIFERASEKTELKFSPHDLGRFTQTQLENARIQPNWIKKITAHKIKGEENLYSRPKIEKLREAYQEAIPFLTTKVKEISREDIEKIERKYREENERFKSQLNGLANMESENVDLKGRLKVVESEIADVKGMIKKFLEK